MTNFISTLASSSAMRLHIQRMQIQLMKSQMELSSGTVADEGLALGAQSGRAFSLRHEQARLQSITDANAVASTRMEGTQNALGSLASTAHAFLTQLTAAAASQSNAGSAIGTAKSGLAALTQTLNTTIDGNYIFAGINSDARAMADYQASPASANKLAMDAAFAGVFGFSQTSASVSSISAASMQGFLDKQFDAQFSPAQFSANWSAASGSPIRSRISISETADTSVSANSPALRKLAAAYTMVADLGADRLGAGAYQTVMTSAIKAVGEALSLLTQAQTDLGNAQSRVAGANDRMALQKSLMDKTLGQLENIDSYATSTNITMLTTQIETSYSLTSRLQQLSLLKYL